MWAHTQAHAFRHTLCNSSGHNAAEGQFIEANVKKEHNVWFHVEIQ